MFYQNSVLSEFEEKGLTLQEALDALDGSKIQTDLATAIAYLELHMIATNQKDTNSLEKHYKSVEKQRRIERDKFIKVNKASSSDLDKAYRIANRNIVQTLMALLTTNTLSRNASRMSITGKEVFK